MNIVFKKRQLRLMEDETQSIDTKTAPRAIIPSGDGNSTATLQKDVSQTQEKGNPDNSPLAIQTGQYTKASIPQENDTMVTTMNNDSKAPTKLANMINKGNPDTLPGTVILKNGFERSKNLVEVATFSKKELTKFLKSL